ncbi:dihydropteroate synthase [soil metagenome]
MPTCTVEAGGHTLEFGGVTHVMGVINLSPESKNRHTVVDGPVEALDLARRYRDWGADLVDLGGQSSHYDSSTLEIQAEVDRLCPAVEALARAGFVVSVDTWRTEVAEAAISAGAAIVNDTGGLRSSAMRDLIGRSEAAVVAVHVDGEHPHAVGSVIDKPDKATVIADRFRALISELEPAISERLLLDPGIAINYRGDYSAYTRLQLEVIRSSDVLAAVGRPLLIPIPRKQDISWVSAYVAMSLEYGADMIRVHDVALAADLVRLWGREAPR